MGTAADFPAIVVKELKRIPRGDTPKRALATAVFNALNSAKMAAADWIAGGCQPSIESAVSASGLLSVNGAARGPDRDAPPAESAGGYETLVRQLASGPDLARLPDHERLPRAAAAAVKQAPDLHADWRERGFPALSLT